MDDIVRRRRVIGLLTIGVLVTALSFGFGHRGVHAVRSLILPGAGLYDHRHVVLGITLPVAAIAATVAWMRWGTDWMVVAVLVASMSLSAALAYDDHPVAPPQVAAAAHEFPLVVIVMGGLSWVRLAWRRSPVGRRRTLRAEPTLSALDRCRATAIAALATGSAVAVESVDITAWRNRSRRVGIAARARFGGDPLRVDHAHVRATLSLVGHLEPEAVTAFRADAAKSLLGVPASEPGWVRLLDGTLAALALQFAGDSAAGERWSTALSGPFQLRRGLRPAAWWTPLAVRGPRGATWEHAAAAGLARSVGWITTDDDWTAVRTRALAAAARGTALADDERLVAAARLWLPFVDDAQAARIIARVTVHRDPVAIALDAVATSLVTSADHTLRPPTRSTA